MKLTYLAIPYTFNPCMSFEIANKVASDLILSGKIIFSPISHSHPISDYMDESLRLSQELWTTQDLEILNKCDEIIFVIIGNNGRELLKNSKGCQSELERAKELGINIIYYEYYDNK